MQKNIRNTINTKPTTETKNNVCYAMRESENKEWKIIPIIIGPISLNSVVLKPFSPVPTNAITNPSAIVPKPMYRKAFAKVLGPRITLIMSSSSDEPASDTSWTYIKI